MPNKEERICIFKENFDTNITEIEGPKYITRAEAVERMGYAMCKQKHQISDCADCEDASVGMCDLRIYHLRAIAALDALLGGKNA